MDGFCELIWTEVIAAVPTVVDADDNDREEVDESLICVVEGTVDELI